MSLVAVLAVAGSFAAAVAVLRAAVRPAVLVPVPSRARAAERRMAR
jgi:hypothetical protein